MTYCSGCNYPKYSSQGQRLAPIICCSISLGTIFFPALQLKEKRSLWRVVDISFFFIPSVVRVASDCSAEFSPNDDEGVLNTITLLVEGFATEGVFWCSEEELYLFGKVKVGNEERQLVLPLLCFCFYYFWIEFVSLFLGLSSQKTFKSLIFEFDHLFKWLV